MSGVRSAGVPTPAPEVGESDPAAGRDDVRSRRRAALDRTVSLLRALRRRARSEHAAATRAPAQARALPAGASPTGPLPAGSSPTGALPTGASPTGPLPTGASPTGPLPDGAPPSGAPRARALPARVLRALDPRTLSPPARVVAVAAVLSAIAAVLLDRHLFPFLSINNDEPVYRLQAQVLAKGHLFPDAPDPAASYTPWLAAVRDGHYVLKYTPVVPAYFALSIVLTGGTGTASAVLAAGAVVTTYLLGREVLSERRTAAVAAVLFALSPLVVFQSAFLLPYLPVLVLVELALIGVLRGVRGGRPRPMVGAGLALGVAFATRPFDMLLFLLPVAVWLLWTQPGRRWWTVRWLAAGLALPAALLLAFDAAATGRPFTLPFALLEPKDTLGFGVRKLYPSDGRHDFGIVDGLSGVGEHLWLLGGWAFGGAVLAVLAIVAVARRRVAGAATALGAGALLMLVGYIGFWGVWNAAVLWGGIRYVGPFYVLPVVLPLVLLGAQGLVDLLRWRPAAGGVAVAGAAALSGVVLAGALPANVTFTDNDRDLSRMVRAAAPRSLVLAAPDPLFLMHPSAVTSNPPQPGGRAVYALAHGVDDFAVLASHPDRTPFLLRFAGGYNRSPHGKASVRLDQLTLRTGPDVPLRVSVRAPGRIESAWLTVSSGASTTLYAIEAGRTSEATVLVGPTGVTVSGVGPALAVEANPTVTSTLTVALRTRQREGARVRTVDRQAVPVRHAPDGSGVEVIAPLRTVGLEGNGPAPAVRVLAG